MDPKLLQPSVPAIIEALKTYQNKPCLQCMSRLAGEPSNMQMILDGGVIPAMVQMMKENSEDAEVGGNVFATFAVLAQNPEAREQMLKAGVLKMTMDWIAANVEEGDTDAIGYALKLLASFSLDPVCAKEINDGDTLDAVMDILEGQKLEADDCGYGVQLFANVAGASEDLARQMVDAGNAARLVALFTKQSNHPETEVYVHSKHTCNPVVTRVDNLASVKSLKQKLKDFHTETSLMYVGGRRAFHSGSCGSGYRLFVGDAVVVCPRYVMSENASNDFVMQTGSGALPKLLSPAEMLAQALAKAEKCVPDAVLPSLLAYCVTRCGSHRFQMSFSSVSIF